MGERRSRTYKLKLSRRGINLFLDCHGRVCRLVSDFLPYGTTLQIAVEILATTPIDEVISELCSAELSLYGGPEIRYVGASPKLMEEASKIAQRIEVSDLLSPIPQTWKIYLAALLCMRSSDDALVLRTYAGIIERSFNTA